MIVSYWRIISKIEHIVSVYRSGIARCPVALDTCITHRSRITHCYILVGSNL